MLLILKQLAPEFVRATALREYAWSDWDPYPALGDRSDEIELRLLKVSHRARLAYTIGCAIWVLAMLNSGEADDEAWAFLDAAWLCQVSDRYVAPEAPTDSPIWQGPRRGPIHLALLTVENCFAGIEEDNSEMDASFAALIPSYITANLGVFNEWSSRFLALLEANSPASESEGEPVPPELLSVWSTRNIDHAEALEAFVAAETSAGNPFVTQL